MPVSIFNSNFQLDKEEGAEEWGQEGDAGCSIRTRS